jgi:hypothetical protein
MEGRLWALVWKVEMWCVYSESRGLLLPTFTLIIILIPYTDGGESSVCERFGLHAMKRTLQAE